MSKGKLQKRDTSSSDDEDLTAKKFQAFLRQKEKLLTQQDPNKDKSNKSVKNSRELNNNSNDKPMRIRSKKKDDPESSDTNQKQKKVTNSQKTQNNKKIVDSNKNKLSDSEASNKNQKLKEENNSHKKQNNDDSDKNSSSDSESLNKKQKHKESNKNNSSDSDSSGDTDSENDKSENNEPEKLKKTENNNSDNNESNTSNQLSKSFISLLSKFEMLNLIDKNTQNKKELAMQHMEGLLFANQEIALVMRFLQSIIAQNKENDVNKK